MREERALAIFITTTILMLVFVLVGIASGVNGKEIEGIAMFVMGTWVFSLMAFIIEVIRGY